MRTLKERAGDKVFTRGEAYAREGKVEILDSRPDRVLARVAGMDDYRTVITGQGTAITGECSCPAFARDGACKHMVAAALAANAAAASGEAGSGSVLQRIRAHLETRNTDELIAMIIDSAERDPALLDRLDIAAAAADPDATALETRLRTAIRAATRTRGFVDYDDARRWAAAVDGVLDMLAAATSGRHAARVLELAGFAISQIEDAIESIDDSDGHGSMLLAKAQQIHLEACRGARPDPVALARDLFRRETEGEYDTFHAAAAQYAEVLGKEGLAEYRRLAQAAWDRLPARIGPSRDGGFQADGYRLASILDFFAERDGDVALRIALRAKNLSSPWAVLQLAAFCRDHGREEEALRHAQEGLCLFEDGRPDERLVCFVVDLLLAAGQTAQAETHLWRAFEKVPSLNLYGRLQALGGEGAAERAIGRLQRDLDVASPAAWHHPADLLVRVLVEAKRHDAAWDSVRAHGASQAVREALARASESTHPNQALAVYAERVEELARAGGGPAYEDAAALIGRMRPLRDAAEQAAYLSDIKARHGRKRNFMKLLG
ncbi:MAG TPA: SWIM zinc finger family protein [Bosea sp. (in: a-proteobacteria)]